MGDPTTSDAGAITHCEWCGVEFDDTTEPRLRTTPPPPAETVATAREAETHCEWCGAAYPQPEADA